MKENSRARSRKLKSARLPSGGGSLGSKRSATGYGSCYRSVLAIVSHGKG
jgi:hypothetical protein